MRTVRRRVAAAVIVILTACGLAVAGPSGPAFAAEAITDGGFEQAAHGAPPWEGTNTIGYGPFCPTSCGGIGPRTGSGWAWFGGALEAETQTATQTVTIPAGSATLSFWMQISAMPEHPRATLSVYLDETLIVTLANVYDYDQTWKRRSFDVSGFAGGTHTLKFLYVNPDSKSTPANFNVDDVSIASGTRVATPTPVSATPVSPSTSVVATVTGTAEAGSTVQLFTDAACSGLSAAEGSAATFAGAGFDVEVPANTVTTFYARAYREGQPDSACSTTSVSYTNDLASPDAPAELTVTPGSPAPSTSPVVHGVAEPGSTVNLYEGSSCSGAPVASGTAEQFASGFVVSVPEGTTSTFTATATDAVGNVSSCSFFVTYQADATAPEAPGLTMTPASPGATTGPVIKGHAETGSTVTLYADPACAGSAKATGSAADLEVGIRVSVAPASTTTFTATATDAAGNVSPCSAAVSYTQQTPPVPAPETSLISTPAKKVTTKKKTARVAFSFASSPVGALFECSMDGGVFTACGLGQPFRVKPGNHVFAVRAVVGGVADPTPASYAFKVKKVKRKHR